MCLPSLQQVQEPILLLGKERFEGVDIRVRVKGGGHVSRIYGTFKVISYCCILNYLLEASSKKIKKNKCVINKHKQKVFQGTRFLILKMLTSEMFSL